jgi:hypothetical protein
MNKSQVVAVPPAVRVYQFFGDPSRYRYAEKDIEIPSYFTE